MFLKWGSHLNVMMCFHLENKRLETFTANSYGTVVIICSIQEEIRLSVMLIMNNSRDKCKYTMNKNSPVELLQINILNFSFFYY